jgi:2-C-methyl-D-erythritol 2,4-cyclodiphosphate synthase
MKRKKSLPRKRIATITRTGFGYDIHLLTENRKLILGGVDIPSTKGLLGHSDADVLLHAICDALLGAVALGDIGKHFPDTDVRYSGISSLKLLEHVVALLKEAHCSIFNIDSTLVLEHPKIVPYVAEMQQNIARATGLQINQISIKATTNEKLGAIGRGEGCAAFAVASLQCPLK